jgi:hypothetical protein
LDRRLVFVPIICNKLSETDPGFAVKQVEKLSGELSGVSASTVQTVRTDFKSSGGLTTLRKERQHQQRIDKYEVFVKLHFEERSMNSSSRMNRPPWTKCYSV